jgi:hypothetical protein
MTFDDLVRWHVSHMARNRRQQTARAGLPVYLRNRLLNTLTTAQYNRVIVRQEENWTYDWYNPATRTVECLDGYSYWVGYARDGDPAAVRAARRTVHGP